MQQGPASSLWGKSTGITMHIGGKRIGKETASIWKELCKVLVCFFFVASKRRGRARFTGKGLPGDQVVYRQVWGCYQTRFKTI
jgi:hypothetical protein